MRLKSVSRLNSNQYSVSSDPVFSFEIEGVPKIISMILENERECGIQEKFCSYIISESDDDEWKILEKWIERFKTIIHNEYPTMNDSSVRSLAVENAHYLTSIFRPEATVVYNMSLSEANYIRKLCVNFVSKSTTRTFDVKLKPWLAELASMLECVVTEEAEIGAEKSFLLFAERYRQQFFDECYSINYKGSFYQLSLAQKRRNIWYEIIVPDLSACGFYVPLILSNKDDIEEWLKDMDALKDNYPLGMLVEINERGVTEAFFSKCFAFLCGSTPLELCMDTATNLNRFGIECKNYDVREALRQFYGRRRCTLVSGYQCPNPCPLGPKQVYDRKI